MKMDKETYDLLYYYKDDEISEEGYNLSEVQLLEVDVERAKKLIKLLENSDLFIVYQTCLILIAWGYKEAFEKFNQFITNRWDKKTEFSPHRINGEDNVYDEFSYAFLISTYNNTSQVQLIPYFSKILELYGVCFFESKLKEVLLKLNFVATSLLFNIKKGITLAINNKRYYQASQLLPVISKYDKPVLNEYIEIFKGIEGEDVRIKFNLEEATKSV